MLFDKASCVHHPFWFIPVSFHPIPQYFVTWRRRDGTEGGGTVGEMVGERKELVIQDEHRSQIDSVFVAFSINTTTTVFPVSNWRSYSTDTSTQDNAGSDVSLVAPLLADIVQQNRYFNLHHFLMTDRASTSLYLPLFLTHYLNLASTPAL